ncbi:hypothetical protein [Pedobacter punctiformis]|uniref:DUF3299 domain-containing protein n=1 Tax=Pedobacter punctiformis TaxID=3004097 RepID=A0ABT4LAT8_9SPHI|nr:hypothetical protein [Pedobacter sp. HCMS5-2]MCZ4245020.1 hypothetical protein [Pedobacter sp. HCMS5-2]
MIRIAFIFLVLLGFTAKAQHDPSDQMESANWDVIGGVEFKTIKPTEMYAIYNANIKKYENKQFDLTGYIVPIKDGMKQTKFMLSTLPINQCFFCGKNGVPIMVLVEMTEPVKFTYQPISVKGVLKLNKGNAMDNPPIALIASKQL